MRISTAISLLVVFCSVSTIYGIDINTRIDSVLYSPKTKVLLLKNGEYCYGELIDTTIEGILFQAVKGRYQDIEPPRFYIYPEILELKTIQGKMIDIQYLKKKSIKSIKDYNLPELIKKRKQESLIHPFYVKLNFDIFKGLPTEYSERLPVGSVTNKDSDMGSGKAIEVGYYFHEKFGFGFSSHSWVQPFEQSIVFSEIDTLDLPAFGFYNYKIKYQSIFSPVFYYRTRLKQSYFVASCTVDPVKILIIDEKDNELLGVGSSSRGLGIGTNLGLIYIINRYLGLDASVGFKKYFIIDNVKNLDIVDDFYNKTCFSVSFGLGYYFSIESFY